MFEKITKNDCSQWVVLISSMVVALVVVCANLLVGHFVLLHQVIEVAVGDTPVTVEIARTPEQRKQGLSGRPSLAEGAGMLFVHPVEDTYAYWMPDMLIPLDIIWISTDMKVVHIEADVRPESYPKSFSSNVPARYVLEVPAGFTTTHTIVIGDIVTLR